MAVVKSRNDIEKEVQALLAPFGILPMGWFSHEGSTGLLLGNVGSSLWQAFKQSSEFLDGAADPMNRWTQALIDPIGLKLGAEVRYPFGEKIWPFQVYAQRAMGMNQSPIGLYIHPTYGLWTAFRSALVFEDLEEIHTSPSMEHPCDTCAEKPCLSTCPVGVFAPGQYEYQRCKSHVKSKAGTQCMQGGCLARLSCPVGRDYAYDKDHQAFHMKAFAG